MISRAPCTPSLLALFLAAACASANGATDRRVTLLSAAPPPDGRLCQVASNPAVLPSPAALTDSVALIDGVRVGHGEQSGYALLSLRFDEQGHPIWVRVIESNLGPDAQRTVEGLVVRTLRPEAPGSGWSVRMRVGADSAPTLQVGRSEICPATLSGLIEIKTHQVVRGSSRGTLPEPTATFTTPRFSILVDTTGRLLDSKLLESSGDQDVDRQFQSALQRGALRPTLLDGTPVLAWTVWPPAKG